ncbi:hypothetical protein GHT06_003828 [Daphnia sinensis]|uniref:Uncharacterized protein n=1 Tax=Daphnia sinensis TaxID=1820382 RepID=A0AAD5KDS2_9CRUS|nr:hypothetical protein GHT06_003828 [Daphnia sinensis]
MSTTYAAKLATEHKTKVPMRHLQIVNTIRYARDFEISEEAAAYVALVVHYFIVDFTARVTTAKKSVPFATCIPKIAVQVMLRNGAVKYPFSKAIRVAEDVYQRLRKLVTNDTSVDFNLMTMDEPDIVLKVNRALKEMDDAIRKKETGKAATVYGCFEADDGIMKGPLKAPTCTEIQNIRRMQFLEDLYCRWRNTMYNCKNLHPVDAASLDSDTVMALYYNSLDNSLKANQRCLNPTPVCGTGF